MKRSTICVSWIMAVATASIVIAAQTAAALDVGVSGGSGGGLGASVGGSLGGTAGASVGGSISAGGLDAGASVSAGSGGVSVGGSVGGLGGSRAGEASGIGGASAALGASSGSGTAGSGANSGGPRSGQSASTGSPQNISNEARARATVAVGGEVASGLLPLPVRLVPLGEARDEGAAWMLGGVEQPTDLLAPLIGKLGTPHTVVDACHAALASAALPYGAVTVDVVSAGKSTKTKGGGLAAPIEVRIVYSAKGRRQVRQARVSCRLNANGQVVAAL